MYKLIDARSKIIIYGNYSKYHFLKVVSELIKEIGVCQIWNKSNSKEYYLVQQY